MELTEACEYGLSVAEKMGADQSESYAAREDISFISREAKRAETKNNALEGVGFRVVSKNAMGFAYTSNLAKKEIRIAVKTAYDIAKSKGKDPHFKSLPEPKASTVKGTFDKKLAALEFDDIAEIFESIESSSRIHKALKPIFTSVIKFSTQDVLMNSLGVNSWDRAAIFVSFLGILTTKGITPNFHMDVMSTRRYDFDPAEFAKQVGEETLACSGPKTIGFKGKCDVILHPNALIGIPKGLMDLVMHQVKAGSLVERKSLFIDKINEEIASPKLTITDDGTLNNGIFTSSHDAEGVPRQKTTIINKGILRSFLYDTYYGDRFGKESTGNSSRFNMTDFATYKTPPFIDNTNLVVEKGHSDLEDLIGEIRDGFYIKSVMGTHTANELTGEFSLPFSGFRIENGRLKAPVMMTMVSGNIVNLLREVDGITKERKKTFYMLTPWLKSKATINATKFGMKIRAGLVLMKILTTLGIKKEIPM